VAEGVACAAPHLPGLSRCDPVTSAARLRTAIASRHRPISPVCERMFRNVQLATLKWFGKNRWRGHVAAIVTRLRTALETAAHPQLFNVDTGAKSHPPSAARQLDGVVITSETEAGTEQQAGRVVSAGARLRPRTAGDVLNCTDARQRWSYAVRQE
jgi:hypothetical protein